MNDQEYLENLVSMFDDDHLPASYIDAEVSHNTLIEGDIVIAINYWLNKFRQDIPDANYVEIISACNLFWITRPRDVSILWERVFDAMNKIAPKGCYFGVHPGNGSLFGFFQLEEDPFELEEPFNERPI